MKSSNRRSFPFLFCIVIEGCLLFSFISAYSFMALGGRQEESAEPYLQPYRHLLQNYRTILTFLRMQPEPKNVDSETNAPDPVFANFLLIEKIEKAFTQVPPLDPLEDITKLAPIHPFFIEKKKEFLLQRQFQEKRYQDYIRFYSNPRQNKQLSVWMIDALLKTGKRDAAFSRFKEIFSQNNIDQLPGLLTSPDWQGLLGHLDEDSWFRRFRFLLQREDLVALNRELPLCRRFPLLATLFKAEYYFARKKYDLCRRLLAKVANGKYRLHAEKLLLKIDLRNNNTGNIFATIERLRPNPELCLETLLDAANQLFIAKRYEEALLLYAQYMHDSPFQDENRWKSIWLMAWTQWRLRRNEKAAELFLEGAQSPIFPYRVACYYWAAKLGKSKEVKKVPAFPLTYYSMKTYGVSLFSLDARRFFINTLNQAPSAFFKQTIAIVSRLLWHNAWEQAYDMVDWTFHYPGLRKVDQKMLAVLKSILLYKQNDLRRTYINYKNNIAADLPGGFPPFLAHIFYPISFQDLVFKYSRAYAVDPLLIMAIIREESFFQANAFSSARAMGIMQLIYETAKQTAFETNLKIRRADLFNPEINIRLGILHFRSLLSRYGGKIHLALAAYNAGESRIDQWLQEFGDFAEEEFIEMIPFSQTRNYVKNVLLNYFLYTHYYEKC